MRFFLQSARRASPVPAFVYTVRFSDKALRASSLGAGGVGASKTWLRSLYTRSFSFGRRFSRQGRSSPFAAAGSTGAYPSAVTWALAVREGAFTVNAKLQAVEETACSSEDVIVKASV